MQTDPNYYRDYVCNIQAPKMKARELRVTKDLEVAGAIDVAGDLDVHSGDILTTGDISCSKLTASTDVASTRLISSSVETDSTTTGSLTASQAATLSGGVTVTGASRINSDTTRLCPFSNTAAQGWASTKLDIYSRAPDQGLGRSYLRVGPTTGSLPDGVMDINSVVEGYSTTWPISLKVQNQEIAKFGDANTILNSNVSVTKNLTLTTPYYGYSDFTKFPSQMTQPGYRIEEATTQAVFPALGTWVTADTLSLGVGVWMIYGQLNIQNTPGNFCNVNKWGIQILSPTGATVALSEDRTNINKAISDNTSFTVRTMGISVITATGTVTLQGYVNHTGTNTNVYTTGGIPYSVFGAVRIA